MKFEGNGSITIEGPGLTDGTGQPRKLNVHAYRVANTLTGSTHFTIVDHRGKPMGSVILHKDDIITMVEYLLGKLMV